LFDWLKLFGAPWNQRKNARGPETDQSVPHKRRGLWENLILAFKQQGLVVCSFFGCSLIAALSLSLSASAEQQKGQQGNQQTQSPQSQQTREQALPSNPNALVQVQPGQKPTDNQNNGNHSQGQATTPTNDRLFGVLPNYLTVENQAKVPPLTSGGKYRLVAKNAFDPMMFPFLGFVALVGHAQNSEPEYGQGAAGFGRRYGVAFGDSTVESFMTGAVFPSLFKQDPRYYQLVHGGFVRRAIYSVSRILIARTDSGHRQFNSSEIVGNLVAAGISNAYHPAADRSLANTLSVWGTGTGWDTLANLAEEFWPDIHHWLKRRFISGSQG
jgi:hypothetical protein